MRKNSKEILSENPKLSKKSSEKEVKNRERVN